MRWVRSVSSDINLLQVQVQNCNAWKMNIHRVYYDVALHEALGRVGSDAGWTMEDCETDFRFVWREQRSQFMAGCWLLAGQSGTHSASSGTVILGFRQCSHSGTKENEIGF